MGTDARPVHAFVPTEALSARFEGWTVQFLDMPTDKPILHGLLASFGCTPEWHGIPDSFGELVLPRPKRIILSRAVAEADPDFAFWHAVAHVAMHHVDTGDPFTDDECDQADETARLFINREITHLPRCSF